MNVKLLEQVKQHILVHPNRFVMDAFLLTPGPLNSETFESDRGDDIKFDSCGTAACIAGWSCLLTMKQKGLEVINFHGRAKRYLEISNDQANRLFYTDNWPWVFSAEYSQAITQTGRARVAARRIDHFIATEGRK